MFKAPPPSSNPDICSIVLISEVNGIQELELWELWMDPAPKSLIYKLGKDTS